MRTTPKALLGLALALATLPRPAAAQPGPPQPNPYSVTPSHTYDLTQYGLKAGATAPGTGTIDDAVANVKAKGPGYSAANRVTFLLPANQTTNPFYYYDPVLLDKSGTTVKGAGVGLTTVKPVYNRSTDGFVFGVSPSPGGTTLADDHWVDLNGLMTFATAAGQYYGYSTTSASQPTQYAHLAMSANPFSHGHGDYFSGQTQWTTEFCVKVGNKPLPAGGTGNPATSDVLLGLADPRGVGGGPHPEALYPSTNGVLVYGFKTADQTGSDHWQCSIPLGTGNLDVVHVAVCVDLTVPVVYAFTQIGASPGTCNQITPAVSKVGTSGLAWAAASNLTLAPNYEYSWHFGTHSASDWGAYSTAGSSRIPYPAALLGYKRSKWCRYKNNGAGQPQARADNGAAPTDAWRYLYTGDSLATCFLTLQDKPASQAKQGGRVVHGGGLGSVTNGYFLSTGVQGFGNWDVTDCEIADLVLDASSAHYGGVPVAFGAVEQFTAHDLTVSGGFRSVASQPLMGTTWSNTLRGLKSTEPYDASVFLYQTTGTLVDDVRVPQPGTTVYRVGGSGATFRHTYVAIDPQLNSAVWRNYGFDSFVDVFPDQAYSYVEVDGLKQDGENSAYPALAALRAAPSWNTGTDSRVVVKNWWLGAINPAAPFFDLRSYGATEGQGGFKRGKILIDGVQSFSQAASPAAAWVRTDGPIWDGNVLNLQANLGTNVPLLAATADADGTGAQNNVRVLVDWLDARPTSGKWVAGTRLRYRHPRNTGDVVEDLVTTSGDFAGTPPVFKAVSTLP